MFAPAKNGLSQNKKFGVTFYQDLAKELKVGQKIYPNSYLLNKYTVAQLLHDLQLKLIVSIIYTYFTKKNLQTYFNYSKFIYHAFENFDLQIR